MIEKKAIHLSKQLLLFVILLIGSGVQATVYYVDSNIGKSYYNGTSESSPWDSLRTVCNNSANFQPGDIIKFKKGQRFYNFYNGGLNCSGSTNSPITFQSYSTGSAPVLSTAKRIDQETSWTDLGDGRYLYTGYTGFAVALIWQNGSPIKKASSSALTDGDWHLVSGIGIYIRPTDGQAYSTHEYYLSNNTCIFTIANDSYLKFMDLDFEYTVNGIYNTISATSASVGIEVTSCNFSKLHSGIRLNSPSTSVENHDISVTGNNFTDVRFAFICTGLDGAGRHYNLTISNNNIANLAINGAYVMDDPIPDVEALSFQNLEDSIISGNVITHGVKLTDGITNVQNEPVFANGIIIWVNSAALIKNVTISNNTISDLSGAIILGSSPTYVLQNNQISGNVIENCELGMKFNSNAYADDETLVQYNELYGNDINIWLYSGARGYVISDNASFWPGQYHVKFSQSGQFTDSMLDNNCYMPDGALWRNEYTSTTYSNFAAWQATGQDANSTTMDYALKLWLRADTGTLNGAGVAAQPDEAVQTWQDQSGNSWDFACNYSTRRPTLKSNASPNGTNGLCFNGTYNCMNLPGKSATFKSVYIAFKNDVSITKTATQQVPFDMGTDEELVFGSCTSLLTDEMLTVFSKNSAGSYCRSGYTSSSASIAADFHTIAIVYNATNSFDIYLDGAMVSNATSRTDNTPLTVNGTCYIGGRDLAGSYFKGYVFEIIAYDAVHGPTQVADIVNYLEIKYKQ